MYIKECLLMEVKPGVTQVTGICSTCGKQWNLCVLTTALDNYVRGISSYKAFPNLSESNRELLISGRCEKCSC